jgi:hypothetical protein
MTTLHTDLQAYFSDGSKWLIGAMAKVIGKQVVEPPLVMYFLDCITIGECNA